MSFVPYHVWIGDRASQKVAFVLHGILGSGSNFRSLIKRLSELRPDYCFVLVDLRLHGRSSSAPAPHTLGACAADLAALATEIGRDATAVIGHSFGGKVALCYAKGRPVGLAQTWVLDAYPGAHAPGSQHEVQRVIEALGRVPAEVDARETFVEGLLEQGLSSGIAQWLSQNLMRHAGRYRLRLDLAAVRDLLADYFQQDLWSVIQDPAPGQDVCLVIAE